MCVKELTNGKHDTDGETQKHQVVSTTGTKEPLGTQGTPEDCRGEEGVVTGASEAELGVLGANVLEGHLEVQDTGRNKGEDQGSDHLTSKSVVGLDVGVVCQLQVVRECECLVAGNVTESLEPADRQ